MALETGFDLIRSIKTHSANFVFYFNFSQIVSIALAKFCEALTSFKWMSSFLFGIWLKFNSKYGLMIWLKNIYVLFYFEHRFVFVSFLSELFHSIQWTRCPISDYIFNISIAGRCIQWIIRRVIFLWCLKFKL